MIEINLLGREIKGELKEKSNKNVFAVFIVTLFLIEIAILAFLTYKIGDRFDSLERKRDRLSSIERSIGRVKVELNKVNNMIKTIKRLERGRGEAAEILEKIANTIPTGYVINTRGITTMGGSLWFTRLYKRGNVVTIYGKSFSAEAVADYMMRLGRLKDIVKVRFTSGGLRKLNHINGIDVYSFSIAVTLKG